MVEGVRRGPRTAEHGGSSRDDILAAARGVFADTGFQGATIKAIADAAGVDSKLVHYYFGTKRDLFSTVIAEDFRSRNLLATVADGLAETPVQATHSPGTMYVRTVLTAIKDPHIGPTFLGLVRNLGVHEESRRIFLDFVTTEVIAPLAPKVRGETSELSISLVGSQLLGLIIARHVLAVPAIAGADVDSLAARVGPTLDRYLGIVD